MLSVFAAVLLHTIQSSSTKYARPIRNIHIYIISGMRQAYFICLLVHTYTYIYYIWYAATVVYLLLVHKYVVVCLTCRTRFITYTAYIYKLIIIIYKLTLIIFYINMSSLIINSQYKIKGTERNSFCYPHFHVLLVARFYVSIFIRFFDTQKKTVTLFVYISKFG